MISTTTATYYCLLLPTTYYYYYYYDQDMHFDNYADVQNMDIVKKKVADQDEKMRKANALVLGVQPALPLSITVPTAGLVSIDGGGGFRSAAGAKAAATQRLATASSLPPQAPRSSASAETQVIDDDEDMATPKGNRGRGRGKGGGVPDSARRAQHSRSRTPVGRNALNPDKDLVLRGGAQSQSVQAVSGSSTTIDAEAWLWGYGPYEHNKLTGV